MPPTILQIIPRLDTGGAELATIEITDAIVRAGGRALVVTAGGRILSLKKVEPTLEDVFIELVGHGLGGDKPADRPAGGGPS